MSAHTPLRWRLPLSPDQMGVYLFDANRTMVVQIRGWGHLTGVGGLQLDEDAAVAEQAARLDYIARAVNAHEELIAALRSMLDTSMQVSLARAEQGDAAWAEALRAHLAAYQQADAVLAKVEGRA